MGQESDTMTDYLKDNERFADVFNGGCFRGQKVINPEDLEEGSESYKEVGNKKTTSRIRDVKKRLKSGGRLKILAIEDQNDIEFTMPWRHMNYDSLEYGEQIKQLKRRNRRKKLLKTDAEYKCGLRSTDRLAPVFTACLYHGKEKWTGPRSLKDMINFGEDAELWEPLFSDYQFQLICINELEDFSRFESPLKELFMVLACRQDKGKLRKLITENEIYQKLDSETADVIGVMVGMKKQVKAQKKEGNEVNMCEALRDLVNDSKMEGKAEGTSLYLISMVQAKYRKGKSLEVIADETEETPEVILPILSLVTQYPTESKEEIYGRLQQ